MLMKKTSLFSVLFISLMLWAGTSFGQCVPDSSVISIGGAGIMAPDTLDFIELQTYTINITIIAPDTGTAGTYGFVNLDSIIIKSITNQPGWMNYSCDNIYCRYVHGVLQCAQVIGTPPAGSADTLYLHVLVDAWIHIGPVAIKAASDADGGTIVVIIHGAIGTPEYSKINFEVIQNEPNPFKSETHIGCTTKNSESVSLRVVDMLGNMVYNESMQTRTGTNYFNFNGSELSNGVYFYSVYNGQNHVATRKMVKID
jgi:hypothetical protein